MSSSPLNHVPVIVSEQPSLVKHCLKPRGFLFKRCFGWVRFAKMRRGLLLMLKHVDDKLFDILCGQYLGYPLKMGQATHTGNAEPQLGNVDHCGCSPSRGLAFPVTRLKLSRLKWVVNICNIAGKSSCRQGCRYPVTWM